MEILKRQKKKGKSKFSIDQQIPDVPTLEEFECLLEESPTNYPRGEGIENMESELHSAAIDTELYEQQSICPKDPVVEKAENLQTTNAKDEIDSKILSSLTAIPCDIEKKVEEVGSSISAVQLEDKTTVDAPNKEAENVPEIASIESDSKNFEHDKETKSESESKLHRKDDTRTDIKDVVPFTENQLASLYSNEELALVHVFISEFTETQLKSSAIRQQHRLHELLMSYLRVRNQLIINSHELEMLKKTSREIRNQLWSLEKCRITEAGECQDGNPVSATYEYCIARFNKEALGRLVRNLSAIKEVLHDTQALYCYEAEVLKLQIEDYIQRVCVSCKEFINFSQDLLAMQKYSQASQLMEIRMCITILFNFQRKLLKDGKFVTDTREWLARLVGILLRVATWQDHLFLLNHILRCPGGVMNWARSFIQIVLSEQGAYKLSVSPLNDPFLDHAIATLAVILLPVKDRDKFIEQVEKSLQDTACNPGDTVWLMLDEEGEEDEDISNIGANLYESDLISLLKQIPFSKLFEQILCIEYRNDSYYHHASCVTDHYLLRMFAFFTTMVKLLKQGLKTYDSPRYRQLTKRLSALIRDIVQYANDQWEMFNKNQVTDESTLSKLQLEFDCFFLRAILCIFSSRRLGAWQYLASVPYNLISSGTLWKIFYILHTDSTQIDTYTSNRYANDWIHELNSSQLGKNFEEKLSNMPGDESYFLLTTFANMAMARTDKDYNFVRTTTIDLFQIGFLSEKTQDSCSKDARSLLSNLTNKYPSLLSDILQKLRDNFVSAGKLSLYLFTDLKLNKWIPNEEDIVILSTWLHRYSLTSTENHLARLILAQLNWGFDESDKLYLPIDLHRRIALLTVELTMKYVPDSSVQNASLLAEGVKQVSSMIRPQNAEHIFSLWAWDMISKLRLHQLDGSEGSSRYALTNPSVAFAQIPDMDSDSRLEILVKGTLEKQPIACYVATMMTLWGHSVPLICSKGFTQLEILQSHYRHEQVLLCLHHILPLFLECVDSLLKNDKFINLVTSLITADRTYIKVAKNFILPVFPGTILKQFSNMIHSHLYNFKRYNLQTPTNFIYLWLNTFLLIPDWNKDQSVMYLMDVVIGCAFFHADAKPTVENIFQNLFTLAVEENNENASNRNVIASFGSFLNWATGSSNSVSLLGKSTQSVWVAYQVLLTEQYNREIKTGLWREILKELSAQPKISLDTAIKRACTTVKMQPFGANGLSIYRWSQQALDTPVDHPILPLLWQNFFALFLARVPTVSGVVDHGGIGEKFFEGMINLSYLKKLKKQLNDTTAHFQRKGENDTDNGKPITDERRTFYFNVARFYKTLSLWLEEPRLQEPGLYLPALPPQYMSQKLVLLVQDNWAPWLEYIDYWAVQQNQVVAVEEWERSCYRNLENNSYKGRNVSILENVEPLQRILKRLTTYEYPIPPPPLNRNQSVSNFIYKEKMYNSDTVIDLVKPHLKIIVDYAQTYNMMISEHTAVDSSFLELLPTLYRETENQITLHALCDPARTPPVVHCAGPAVITIKVPEAYINENTSGMIAQNRAEYENLLIKASQPPSSKVTQGCVFIDHLIAILEHEMTVNRTSENSAVILKLEESGVKLFYHLIECYTEEVSFCPPTKQFITTCLEKLGQSFINGEESQGPRLLNTIIEKPNLGGLLGPYFTPVAGSASRFLQMYQTVVKFSTGTSIDLCFVLLSKFDIGVWLNYKRPRLSERSTFIDLVSSALCDIGFNPDDSKLILHELFRNHLRLVLLHEFPEHYGEVLSVVLKSSESQNLSLDVWRDLLGTLSGKPKNTFLIHPSKVRDDIRRYATEQRLLSRQEIYDTAILLNRHFMQERLQYGLYGLYPKYRIYNEPLSSFLGMVGHALVALTLQSDRGSLGDQLCEKIWPALSEMYSPWIAPYWTRNLKEPTAAWIQQLTDDRSVLLPWIITDGPYANKIVAMFVECVRFIIDTLPASSKILCFLWQFYVNNFAHASVKDHILNVIHGNFLSLPWDRFYPSINDVESMVKVIDQYLSDSHLFLGSLFVNVHWSLWINDLLATQSLAVAARMHVCLLNLLVKLSNEPNVRENEKVIELIKEAETFSWHLLDATAYDHIINWHVMSCDSRVMLHSIDNEQCNPIDIGINNLLRIAAGYDPVINHFHPTTLKKRQVYVRSSVKLLITCTTRYKSLLSSNSKALNDTLTKMLDDMEAVIVNTVSESQQIAEASLLITELLHAMNQSGFLMELVRCSWTSWLLKRSASNPILIGILKVIGTIVTSPSVLGDLMEAALEAYFKFNALEEVAPTWASILTILQSLILRQPTLESILVSEGKLLTLYFILLKRLPLCQDIREEGVLLINLVDWISAIRPINIDEEKLPLLWAKACELIYRQCQYNENTKIAVKTLKMLSRSLITFADDGGQGWGILDAIGIRKSSHLSARCKFLSRAIGVYCLAQLPESKLEQQLIRYAPHSPGVASSRATDPDVRPSTEAIKAMQTLEGLVLNKLYAEFKGDIERSIKLIRDPANSLHNATIVIGVLTSELYNQRYLHVLID